MISIHSGATAVRFHTQPLTDGEANLLHQALGALVDTHDVWLAGGDGLGCPGAIAPVDTSEAALLTLMDQLRAHPRINGVTVVVGRFP